MQIFNVDQRGEEVLGEADVPRKALFVIGNEAHGIPIQSGETRSIAIRGAGGVESLNASVAAGILCYELSRAWLQKNDGA